MHRQRRSGWSFSLVTLVLSACALGRSGATPTVRPVTPATLAAPTATAVPTQNPTATRCKPWSAPSGVTMDHVPGRPLPAVVASSTVIVLGTAQPSAEIVNLAQEEMFAVSQERAAIERVRRAAAVSRM